MTWPAPSILLVCDDPRCLDLVATELRAMGCRVFCARDLQQATALVRQGAVTRFVLVQLGEGLVSAGELRAALAAQLPGWSVHPHASADERAQDAGAADRLVN